MTPHFISLRTQLVRQLIPLLLLAILGLFGGATYYSYQQDQQELQRRLQHLLDNGASALANPMIRLNDSEVQRTLDTLRIAPELVYAQVLDNDGKVLATTGNPLQNQSMQHSEIDILYDNDGAKRESPQVIQKVGVLRVDFSQQSLQQALMANLLLGLSLAFLSSLAILASVATIFRRSTGMPLQAIVQSIEAAIEGDAQKLPIQGYNELSLLATAYNQLLDRHSQSINELQDARQAAENALAVKGNFLANMSHELRTPLHAIKGFASLLRDPKEVDKQSHYLSKLDSSCDNLLRLIDNILDFSRLEKGLYELNPKQFSLSALLNRLFELFASSAQLRRLHLDFQVDPQIPDQLLADPVIIENLLLTLLSNAFKFTEQGSIRLTIELVTAESDSWRLRFSLFDTGCGIGDMTDIELFTPFQQLNQTGRQHDGLGLGLSIANALIKLANGSLQVDRQYAYGACFYFELNVKATDSIQQPAQRPDALLLSQDPELCKHLRRWFNHYDAPLELLQDSDVLLRHLRDRHHRHKTLDWLILDLRRQQPESLLAAIQHALSLGYLQHSHLLLLGRADWQLEPQFESQLQQLDWPVNIHQLLGSWFQPDLCQCPIKLPPQISGPQHRLLLVEDNANNQELALELLKPLKLEVVLAVNGQQAVELVQQQHFDLILMDLQMPVMGGEEATSRIRQLPQGSHIPIVALTANALKGVQEGCLSCGMNDFLTKPIQQKQLLETCMRWLKIPLQPAGLTPPASPVWASQAQAFQLDIDTALERLGGDERLYRQLLERFLSRYQNVAQQIQQYLQQQDQTGLKRLAHSLKGLVASLGAQPLYRLCVELEQQAHDLQPNAELIDQLQSKIEHLQQFCQRMGWHDTASSATQTALTPQNLQQLALLLEQNDFSAKELYGQLKLQSSDTDWLQIGQALEAFDFEQASQCLSEFRHKHD